MDFVQSCSPEDQKSKGTVGFQTPRLATLSTSHLAQDLQGD